MVSVRPILLLAFAAALASSARAQAPAPGASDQSAAVGEWTGDYDCLQGTTGLTLTIWPAPPDRLHAIFRFYAVATNPQVPDGCFRMEGQLGPAPGSLGLTAGEWLLHPDGYVTVDLSGSIDRDTITGDVQGPSCTRFTLHRTRLSPRRAPLECRADAPMVSMRD